MRNVTIRRCPTCQNIGSHTDELADVMRRDPDTRVNVVDGNKGEFTVDVDGRRINGMKGDSFRDSRELAEDIRGRRNAGAI